MGKLNSVRLFATLSLFLAAVACAMASPSRTLSMPLINNLLAPVEGSLSSYDEGTSTGIDSNETPDQTLPEEEEFLPEEEIEATLPMEEADVPDDVARSYSRETHDWWELLKHGKLNLSDTTVVYPKFIGFCVKVYNWADKAFNSYDPEYVVGTGKRWKARLMSDNWSDSYALKIRDEFSMNMFSDLYCNAGAYLSYMAISVGYSLDLSNIIGNRPANHQKLGFGFSCARFNFELYYQENTGGTTIRRFGNYENGKLIRREFSGLTMHTIGLNAYYFLNNKRYSQGAAYNYSKIQKKSQGSFIFGVNLMNSDIGINLNLLPADMRALLTEDELKTYRFHYNSYCALLGYGYNFVVGKHVLFNLTTMPKVGIASCYADSVDGDGTLFSLGVLAKGSCTVNLGNYFINLVGQIDGSWYRSDINSFFSSTENFAVNIGVRF